jgi:DNA polymerase-4
VSFCRDCLADCGPKAARCPACGSPRIARHAELDTLTIAHVDCDAFYATIEKRDDPSLMDRPVIVGGGKRGVVAACCYVARTYGIHSAMPMFEAKRRCPDAVVVKPNMAKYVKAGRQVRSAMQALTPLVEPLSIDEAFLDLTGTARLHGMSPAKALARFAREVERDVGITVSIGLSANKFLAKIASDMDKPRGFAVLGRGGGIPQHQAGWIHLRRRRGQCRQTDLRRFPADRRPATRRQSRSDAPLWRGRRQTVASGARPGLT